MKLAEQYKILHDNGCFAGSQIVRYKDQLKRLGNETNSLTLLDYGCGKGQGWQLGMASHIGMMPTLYDPYWKPHSKKPTGKYDGVACVDVLEHVPEDDVSRVLEEIFSYATRFVFLVISTKLAKKVLPDGRNAHLTVKPPDWWKAKIEEAKGRFSGPVEVIYTKE